MPEKGQNAKDVRWLPYRRFGSRTDSEGCPQLRPLSGAKRTSNFGGLRSVHSHKQTLAVEFEARSGSADHEFWFSLTSMVAGSSQFNSGWRGKS
jgi:hypothetical protein